MNFRSAEYTDHDIRLENERREPFKINGHRPGSSSIGHRNNPKNCKVVLYESKASAQQRRQLQNEKKKSFFNFMLSMEILMRIYKGLQKKIKDQNHLINKWANELNKLLIEL